MKGQQLIKKLRAKGVRIETKRGKGGHILATYQGRQTVIKMHGAKDLSNVYVGLVCKTAWNRGTVNGEGIPIPR